MSLNRSYFNSLMHASMLFGPFAMPVAIYTGAEGVFVFICIFLAIVGYGRTVPYLLDRAGKAYFKYSPYLPGVSVSCVEIRDGAIFVREKRRHIFSFYLEAESKKILDELGALKRIAKGP